MTLNQKLESRKNGFQDFNLNVLRKISIAVRNVDKTAVFLRYFDKVLRKIGLF